jgi:hypothetical protein
VHSESCFNDTMEHGKTNKNCMLRDTFMHENNYGYEIRSVICSHFVFQDSPQYHKYRSTDAVREFHSMNNSIRTSISTSTSNEDEQDYLPSRVSIQSAARVTTHIFEIIFYCIILQRNVC